MDELRLLKQKLEEDEVALKDYLAGGSIQSFDGYQRVVGRIEGLNILMGHLDEMIQNIVDS